MAVGPHVWVLLIVPVSATVVVVPVSATGLGLLGACAPPSNPPPLTNHLRAKLAINSSPSSLGKLARLALAAHRSPVPPCHRPPPPWHTGTVTRAGTPSKRT